MQAGHTEALRACCAIRHGRQPLEVGHRVHLFTTCVLHTPCLLAQDACEICASLSHAARTCASQCVCTRVSVCVCAYMRPQPDPRHPTSSLMHEPCSGLHVCVCVCVCACVCVCTCGHRNEDNDAHASDSVTLLGLWCMSPAVAFRSLAGACHSVILASGTLSPLVSFASELGVDFKITLEGRHVVDMSKQVSVTYMH